MRGSTDSDAGPGDVELVDGGAVEVDGPVATGVVTVLVAEPAAPPTQVTASTSRAAPPMSANALLASDIIKSSLSSQTQWHTRFIAPKP